MVVCTVYLQKVNYLIGQAEAAAANTGSGWFVLLSTRQLFNDSGGEAKWPTVITARLQRLEKMLQTSLSARRRGDNNAKGLRPS